MARRAPREGVDQAGVGPDNRVDPHNSSLEQGGNYLPVLAADIRAAHDAVERNALAMAERALEAGRLLLEAKKQIGHGGWLPWLRDNVGIHERTARRYLALAKAGVKADTVADLGIVGATKLVADIEAVPLPEQGEVIEGVDADGRLLFVWCYPDERYLLHLCADVHAGSAFGSHRGIARECLHRRLLNHRLPFDYATATFDRLPYAGEVAELLEGEREAFWQDFVASWPTKCEGAA